MPKELDNMEVKPSQARSWSMTHTFSWYYGKPTLGFVGKNVCSIQWGSPVENCFSSSYGHNPESIARQLIISRLAVLRILKLYQDIGNVYKSHIPGRSRQLSCKYLVVPRNFPPVGYFIKISVPRFSTWKKIGSNRIEDFVKIRGQKVLKSMKKGSIVSKIME